MASSRVTSKPRPICSQLFCKIPKKVFSFALDWIVLASLAKYLSMILSYSPLARRFAKPLLKSDILTIDDLQVGVKLAGTVRNITQFGAFIDIGLKQDAMVHISKISKNYIKNPLDVLSVGQIVDVYVIDVDKERGRVALAMFKD